MKLSVLIVDDEAAARSRLRRLLTDENVEILAEAKDGLEALTVIQELSPDVVFLDVQMPGLDGFEVLRALPAGGPMPWIVFATAFEEHALAAFDAEAVSYLLKPIDREQLQKALARCRELVRSRSIDEELARIRRLLAKDRGDIRQIVARTQKGFKFVPVGDIVFFDVEDGLVRAHTRERTYGTDRSIREFESHLPQPPFFLARRGVIVNLDRSREIEPYFKGTYVIIADDATRTEIIVSERQSKKLRQWLQQ